MPVSTAFQLQFAFTSERTQDTFSRHGIPQQFCHHIQSLQHDLHCVHLSPGAQVWHYIDDILLQWDSFNTLFMDIQVQHFLVLFASGGSVFTNFTSKSADTSISALRNSFTVVFGNLFSCLLVSLHHFFFFLIGVYLLYDAVNFAVLVSTVQQSESALCIHISHPFWISFPFRSLQSNE